MQLPGECYAEGAVCPNDTNKVLSPGDRSMMLCLDDISSLLCQGDGSKVVCVRYNGMLSAQMTTVGVPR